MRQDDDSRLRMEIRVSNEYEYSRNARGQERNGEMRTELNEGYMLGIRVRWSTVEVIHGPE